MLFLSTRSCLAAHFLCKQPSARKNLHFTSRFGTEPDPERGFCSRRQDVTPRKTAWHSDVKIEYSPHTAWRTLYIQPCYTQPYTPPLIPLPSDTPHLRQRTFSPSSGTDSHKHTLRRRHAKPHGPATSQTDFGHRVWRTLHTTIASYTAAPPAPQLDAAFTPACFPLPSGTDSRKPLFKAA